MIIKLSNDKKIVAREALLRVRPEHALDSTSTKKKENRPGERKRPTAALYHYVRHIHAALRP